MTHGFITLPLTEAEAETLAERANAAGMGTQEFVYHKLGLREPTRPEPGMTAGQRKAAAQAEPKEKSDAGTPKVERSKRPKVDDGPTE